MQSDNKRCDIGSIILKGLLLGFFALIYFMLLFGNKNFSAEFMAPNYVLLLGIVVIWGFIVRYIRFPVMPYMSNKVENLCLCSLSVLVFGLQVIICYNIFFRTGWDVTAVWYGTNWVTIRNTSGIQDMSEYFSIYPNNLLLVYLFSRVLKLNLFLGSPISNGGLLLALVQCGVMNFSGMVLFKCAKRFVDQRASWCVYFFYVVLIDLSGWMVLPYSDGIGVLFPVAFLYLYLRSKECSNNTRKCLYIFLLFALCVVAYHIKPYTIIVLISIIIIETVYFLKKIKQGIKFNWSSNVIVVCVAMAGFLCAFFLNSQLIHSMGFTIDDGREMGISHYLMMGLNENSWGGFSESDFKFSDAIYGKELKRQNEFGVAKSRLSEMGVTRYVNLVIHKFAKDYLDGTFGWGRTENFYMEVYPSRGIISDILRSWYYGYGKLFSYHALIRQFLWVGVLAFVPLSIFSNKSLNIIEKVLICTILGFAVYLQLFEAHARYVFVFVPLFLIAASMGNKNMITILRRK